MIKQLIINGLKSYDDFGVYISSRKISQPKKKIIKESIPFSNVVYDFSNINGEIYWEERTLEYTFDIAEVSTELMEEVKSRLLDWLMNAQDVEIYDPYIGDYHYKGSFESDSWNEDFGSGELSVSFTVYPYKISNEEIEITELIEENKTITINNNSSHRILTSIEVNGNLTILFNNSSYSVSNGLYTNIFYLEKGVNELNIDGSGTITFKYREERF